MNASHRCQDLILTLFLQESHIPIVIVQNCNNFYNDFFYKDFYRRFKSVSEGFCFHYWMLTVLI